MSLAASAGRGPGTMWSPTHVQVTVLQARGLRAKGPGGTSDAYAVIQVGKEKYATSVSERSLGAPVWREEATFELPPLLSSGAVPAAAATLQLTVLHRALLGLDKFLGRAEVDLRELHRDQSRRKTQWYTLKSKPGKKNKERGEIEVDIQFMRNNMTASMFDLSMKDKSRSPFGKLKDKIKGKNKDSASDTASAIVPSMTPSVDSDDESFSKDKKKKSKIKTLFSKSNLQKTPLSQSMSVLPTSKPDKVLLRPGDFQSRWDEDDDNEDESSSSTSDVMSHKRTSSGDHTQLSSFSLPRKEGLSFLGGLRSKNDSLSRSNVCINGNHVYLEQPEAKSEIRDSSLSDSPSPQGFRKKHLFASTENLAVRSPKEPGEGGGMSSDRRLSDSSTKDSMKSMSLPSYRVLTSGDIRENMSPANMEATKETKDSKKQESKKSSLLSLVTGKKDVAKDSEGEPLPIVSEKEKERKATLVGGQLREEDTVRRAEKDAVPVASQIGNSPNPFEDVQISDLESSLESKTEPKPPVPAPRAPQTKAVKPRLEVSPEAQPKARLPSPVSALFPTLPSSSTQAPVFSDLRCDSETQSSESPSVFSSSSPLAAPISTSTPLEHWPPTGRAEASSEEPSLFLKTISPKESLTPDENTTSSALGAPCKQLPIPARKGTEESSGSKTRETGTGKEAGSDESGKTLMRHHEELVKLPFPEQHRVPSPEEAQEVRSVLSLHSGRIVNPADGSPTVGTSDPECQSRSSVENDQDGRMTSAVKEATPLPQEEEAASSFDSTTPKYEEMHLSASGGQKKAKKRVSFSEQLFVEEETEGPTGLEEEDGSHRQHLTHEGPIAGSMTTQSPHTEVVHIGEEPVATEAQLTIPSESKSFPEGPTGEASPASGTQLLRDEENDDLITSCQSKASDHEGLLSNPLHDLPSASEVTSPLMADPLSLSLPSIPEVASDDERVDEAGDGRKAVKLVDLEAGGSPLNRSPSCLEKAEMPSDQAHESVPMENLHDFRPKTPEAVSSEQTAALGIPSPHLGKNSSVNKEIPGPGTNKEEKVKGDGRPASPLCVSQGSPVPSSSLSETFPATHSFPSSPSFNSHHSNLAESQQKATTEGSAGKVENFGKKKPLLQAWVTPSEIHPVPAQPSAGAGASKHRLHPVKPMNTTATKIANSSLGTAAIISENLINETIMKKYQPSDPAFAYSQLTHDELIQLVLKQKETISKKEFQVRELEDYIDNLLVRVMEETPNILRVPAQTGRKAGKM
ncbi:rab11 family-interacting protein 1 isoform X1 [Meriones unguiculatus]|uniref:rab11 family-interacting protein 1 isoform X1 n=1 Tax=Meriones unguiculatus TaxID=10047 RepID=UPI00293F1508|nr:rab11 family-interacting protein 1 isoform X1 [Meriones unguiculatus]